VVTNPIVVYWWAITSGAVQIEVTATRLDFIISPNSIEGIDQPIQRLWSGRDINAVIDLDHSLLLPFPAR